MMNFFFRELGCDISHYHGFELNKSRATFEKLVKLRIFLKSRISLFWGSGLVIQGWFKISEIVIRLSAGTKILLMRSFT